MRSLNQNKNKDDQVHWPRVQCKCAWAHPRAILTQINQPSSKFSFIKFVKNTYFLKPFFLSDGPEHLLSQPTVISYTFGAAFSAKMKNFVDQRHFDGETSYRKFLFLMFRSFSAINSQKWFQMGTLEPMHWHNVPCGPEEEQFLPF